ncbi:hypothetical protein GOHSU_14_01570 [Gordonia hirsuta DSM 44140 = NBRC 16056]|uniref:Uncharacterized protein n=1 Tax=Gordonia hirsuta DSM 44140 = NBRC 16056 TaxID=1121927 RepID=L7L791_9ACTN|nr:hypothetical protein [Gordonia hirsuta]GAC56990.1 hypothetical protein GOHSU_14_01570 [Gordonia hirsuta DSM 44140 = NBRC 16056]
MIWAAVAGGLALFLIGFGVGYVTGDQVGNHGERGRYTELHRPGTHGGGPGGDYGRHGHGRFQDNRGPFHDNLGPGHGQRYGGPATPTDPTPTDPTPTDPTPTDPTPGEPAPEPPPQAPVS